MRKTKLSNNEALEIIGYTKHMKNLLGNYTNFIFNSIAQSYGKTKKSVNTTRILRKKMDLLVHQLESDLNDIIGELYDILDKDYMGKDADIIDLFYGDYKLNKQLINDFIKQAKQANFKETEVK